MTTVFASASETYDIAGIREDLTSLIYDISPTETPFFMMCGRGTATSTRHDWQMDVLAAADGTLAQPEGERRTLTGDFEVPVATIRPFNYTQINSKSISVTGTTEAVNKAGRASELSFQLAKRSKEMKRDMEATCFTNQASVLGSIGVARQTASVISAFSDVFYIGGPANPAGNAHTNRSGSTDNTSGWTPATGTWDVEGGVSVARALLESDLKSVIQAAWTNGGDPTTIMAGPFNKTVISGFTGNSTRFDRGEDKRLVAAIDVYVSDFGEHRVIPNRFSRASDVYAFTPELWSLCYLRPFRQHALAKVGDAEDRTILAEWCLEIANQSGNGIVADLTTA